MTTASLGMVPNIEPMLADRGIPSGDLRVWAVEPKLDGWRVTVLADPGLPGGVVVRTRRGHTVTGSVPGIEGLAGIGRSVVLDGEQSRARAGPLTSTP